MSDYYHEKVIRMKVNPEDIGVKNIWDLEQKEELKDLFKHTWDSKDPYMEIAPTESNFVDYVLLDEPGNGDYGFSRMLTEEELEKYLPLFKRIDKNVTGNDLRFVELCWYNCTEAPDYFEVGFSTNNYGMWIKYLK